MIRLQSLLASLISRHQEIVKQGANWKEESYILGKISGVRTAITLIQETDSVVPSKGVMSYE